MAVLVAEDTLAATTLVRSLQHCLVEKHATQHHDFLELGVVPQTILARAGVGENIAP